MNHWIGVIVKKTSSGVAVRQAKGGTQEVFVPWNVPALVEINKKEGVIYSDQHNTAWIEGAEKQQIRLGAYVRLASDVQRFPIDRSEIKAANLDRLTDRVSSDGSLKPPRQPHALIIFHDFQGHLKKGDSGASFAEAVSRYYEIELGFPTHQIKANCSYEQTLSRMAVLGKEDSSIDRILIVTHGCEGQLWLGDPNKPACENTVAAPQHGKPFVSPVAFGRAIKEHFGSGLAISLFSCGMVDGTAGAQVVQALADASKARVVYAARGTVFLHANKQGESTAMCPEGGAVAFYPGGQAEKFGDRLPVLTT